MQYFNECCASWTGEIADATRLIMKRKMLEADGVEKCPYYRWYVRSFVYQLKDLFTYGRDRVTGFVPYEYERDKPFYKFFRSFMEHKAKRHGLVESRKWIAPVMLAACDVEDYEWFISYIKGLEGNCVKLDTHPAPFLTPNVLATEIGSRERDVEEEKYQTTYDCVPLWEEHCLAVWKAKGGQEWADMQEAHASVFGAALAIWLKHGWPQLYINSIDIAYCTNMLEEEEKNYPLKDIKVKEYDADWCPRWDKDEEPPAPDDFSMFFGRKKDDPWEDEKVAYFRARIARGTWTEDQMQKLKPKMVDEKE